MGVQPLLAAIEAMLEPAGTLGVLGAVGRGAGRRGHSLAGGGAPADRSRRRPCRWSCWPGAPTRIVPVRIDSFTAHETGFNAALLPVQATVDLSLTVLRTPT